VSPTTLGNVLYANGQDFSATSTSNLFFDSVNNRVGIGCNAPSYTLDVKGFVNISQALYFPTSVAYGQIQLTGISDNTIMFKDTNAAGANTGWLIGQSVSIAGSNGFGIARTSNNNISATNGVYVASTSYIGINCNAPSQTLDVNGTGSFGNPTWGGTAYIYGGSRPTHTFYGGGTSSGNGTVGIYSTDAYGTGVGSMLILGARSYDYNGGQQHQAQARLIGNVHAVGGYYGEFQLQVNNGGGLPTRLRVDYGGTVFFPVYTNGTANFINSTGQINNTSDRRAKTDIVYMTEPATDTLLALKPARFAFKISPTETHLGFIAQDVETLIPEAVDGKKYEYEWEINDDGTPKLDSNSNLIFTDRPRYRGFSDRPVIATLVKGFQELVDRIKVLEAKLNV
jgi:hypothetical protein